MPRVDHRLGRQGMRFGMTDFGCSKGVDSALRSAALAVSAAQGDAIYRELTRYLATTLGVECAFIASCPAPRYDSVRTLAVYSDGSFEESIEYDLAGTACGTVVGKGFRILSRGARELYPQDRMFRRLNIESYAAYPLTDSTGGPLGLIAIMSRRPIDQFDVVESMLKIFAARASAELERARNELDIRESEASYRAIFEASEDGILIHDWDTGAPIDANPRSCESHGYTREEFLRLKPEEIIYGIPPFTLEEALRHIEAAKSGVPERFEWLVRKRGGSVFWADVSLKAAVIGGQKRIISITRDITERKLAEADLRASEEQYRAIFNASADGMVLIGPDNTIVDVNAAYEVLFGSERSEVVGSIPGAQLAPESKHVCGELIEAATGAKRLQREVKALRRDGTVLDVEVRGVPMLYQGKPHILVILRDISEHKRAESERALLEAQLRQAQKMEAIGHVTGGIAHDFNNILTSITGYLVLASERPATLNDGKLAKYLDQAQLASTKARDLIRQMLTFSRGQQGERRMLNLSVAIRDSVKLVSLTLPSSVELHTELQRTVPAVFGDSVQMEQVLLNLCINARDAMNGSGVIRVSVEASNTTGSTCSSCRKPIQGRWVELKVQDDGRGISPEVMDRMFEPFYSTKEVGKGSGMGLATVHGIVHEHGGHVVVESIRGRGACFRVLLPARDDCGVESIDESIQSILADPSKSVRLRGHVMIVEDERLVREFMTDLLRDAGLEVTVEASAIDARERFREAPDRFDLVVTDQTMPRMSGIALARELSSLRPGVPVVLYTGNAESIAEDEASQAGIRAVLGKPLEPGVLLEVLRQHLPA